MRFGVFLPNGSNGYILSSASPNYAPTFRHNLEISQEAERQGLHFALSMIKYRGFGGATGYWDACLESFTLMAAIGAATSRIELFPSAALLSVHPAIAARMVATIDDVTGGRCGLNIVTGWNKPEYSQMGLWPGEEHFEKRYAYAEEYVQVLNLLWQHGNASFTGAYFQLQDCSALPRPSRKIPIVCAGVSPRGIAFTACHGDYSFASGPSEKLAGMVQGVKAAGAQRGRQLGVYAQFVLIIGESDAQARRIADDIVAGADIEAIANVFSSAGLDTNAGGSAEHLRTGLSRPLEEGNIAFMGSPVIYGSAQTVASKIEDIAAETGIEGMLFSWPDFLPGIRAFGEKVMPKLRLQLD